MNYTSGNYESLITLIRYLKDTFDGNRFVSCYLYPVWDGLFSEAGENAYKSDVQLDRRYIELLDEIVKCRLNKLKAVARLNYRKNQCSSCNKYGFSIFPDGRMGKCSETMHQYVGDIWNGITNKDIYEQWTTEDLDEKCISCKILPLCQGGCRSSKWTKMPQCVPYKNILPEILKWYVDTLREQTKQREKN